MYKKTYRSLCLLSVVTIILTVFITLAACYTSFDTSIKNDVENEAHIIAGLLKNVDDYKASLKSCEESFKNKRVTLISKNGEVLYDNAKKSSLSEKFYKYDVKLDDGLILRVSATSKNTISMFYPVLISVILIAVMMFILTFFLSAQLADNIIKPIEKITSFDEDSFDNAYEEIQPLLRRIARQNREISHQTSKAKTQKARIQAIMDNINEGLLIIDKNSVVLSANECALDIFSKEEITVKHQGLENLTNREEIHIAVEKSLAGTKDNIMFEANSKTYQVFYSPVYEKGEISGAVLLLFDVSQKTETEKIRREFSANVSHELKTPLTTIHGYAQLIASGIAKPDDINGFVKKIEKESSRLIRLVEDIIKLSRLDETTQNPEKQVVSLKTVVNEVLETLSENAKNKEIKIEIFGNDTLVYANLSQLTEMIYNLIDNAVKYNKDGGSINIKLEENTLIISDTGIGIPQKYYDRIFERFFRVDKSHSKQVNGTGLGLSIVKHLAKANNTEISVASELDKGTEFTLKFKN